MAKISTITLPNGSTYEIGSGNAEFIYGTQTAQTGSCLGTTTDTELTDGKEILYFFPYGTSGEVTLNLTLAGGGSTGAINCYKTGLVRMKAFYQYETVRLTYHQALKIGDTYYEGWWADGDKDKDGQELALSRSPYTASAAFYQYIMLFTKDSTTLMPSTSANNDQTTGKTLSTDSFNPFGPIYRYNDTTAVSNGGTIPDEKLSTQQAFDLRRSFNIRVDLIANKAVYLKCNPVSGPRRKAQFVTSYWGTNDPITQDLPSTNDGYYYVYLGQAYSTYALQMTTNHPVYMFKDGECREISQFAEVSDNSLKFEGNDSSYWFGTQEITFPTSGWTSSNGFYTNTVSDLDFTATDTPIISIGVPSTITSATLDDYSEAAGNIFKFETGTGTLTAYSTADITDYNILVLAKGH